MASGTAPRLFPWRIFYRVALIQSLFILVALASSGLVARQLIKTQFIEQMQNRLHDVLMLARDDVGVNVTDWCRRHAQGTALRVTLIAPDHKILCDSDQPADDRGVRNEFFA